MFVVKVAKLAHGAILEHARPQLDPCAVQVETGGTLSPGCTTTDYKTTIAVSSLAPGAAFYSLCPQPSGEQFKK